MKGFPNKFSKPPEILSAGIGKRGDESLRRLNGRGYDVAVGLDEDWADDISVMSQQLHIVEYCPGDRTDSRFADRGSTERWLTKAGGRAVFPFLERLETGQDTEHLLVGYGWTGYEAAPEFDDYPVTSAYRFGNAARRRGLALDYIQVVVSATRHLFTDEGIGLETWMSNDAALKAYERLGFVELRVDPEEMRQTLETASGEKSDRRVHMGYDEEF